MNHCTFSGNISRINELKETASGKKYIKFTLAVDRKVEKGKADFVSLTAFDTRAEFIAKWCKKGTKALVESHFQQGSYQDKNGKTIYTSEFIVDNFEKQSWESDAVTEQKDDYGFVNVADGVEDAGLPFN